MSTEGTSVDVTPDPTAAVADDEVIVETDERLVPTVLEWMADATSVVHTIEEYRVVPWGPNADEMWELGKLTSERLGTLLKVHRVGRRYGLVLEDAGSRPERHFLLDGLTAKSWHDVIVFEAVVGPFFRLFLESFFRSSVADLDGLTRDLWTESQRFIRFGQARTARALAGGDRVELQSALERWLPAVVRALGEVPADLDETWRLAGLRTRTSDQVRQDYLDEIATYLQGNDLEIPAAVADAVCEVEVKWLGEEVAGGGRRDRPLKAATFAFTDRLREGDGRGVPASAPDRPGADASGSA